MASATIIGDDTAVITEEAGALGAFGHRMSWSAIFAGTVVGTATIFFLLTLGSGVGLSLVPAARVALSILNGAYENKTVQGRIDAHAADNKVAVGDLIDRFSGFFDVGDALHQRSAAVSTLLQVDANTAQSEFVNAALGFNHAPAVIAGATATPTPLYALSATSPIVHEGAAGESNMTFALTLDAAPASPVVVYYASQNGTAGGGDFGTVTGKLVFAIGQTTATVSVSIIDDDLPEGDETLAMVFGGAELKTGVAATGTIIDNDDATVHATLIGHLSLAEAHAGLLY